ncbi:MAG: hypothetical protein KAQ98_09010 [Bacteriovoracaceae bacterium]|nr:hypothetical protein [Bacteriovoracaceae bacterium]
MRISTNVGSLTCMRYLGNSHGKTRSSDEQLASGDRIFRTATDPTGLAISERMRAKVRSMRQSKYNASNAISLLQVAEGSLTTMQSLSSRLQELAIRSSTGTLGDSDRSVANREYQSVKGEILRVASITNFFNGRDGLDGAVFEFQVGTDYNKHSKLEYRAQNVMKRISGTGIAESDISTVAGARAAMIPAKKVIEGISAARADLGAIQRRMLSAIENLEVSHVGLSASNSRIRDMDVAKGTANRAKEQIKSGAAIVMLQNINTSPGKILKLIE